eukprot:CAMPEP_0198430132 /NCGR_PEP_ID=MMETSP1452-20131203/11779_1 /TAXON_ID=1181717 /ORGANISM="Synchroma pusillum, Strain CCMP3072" /LENGTH=374 /DNA_ID=CAMNT_0044150563 /DNA_START=1 /DNA_END=1122 /DNA_ORIENTATION=+
MVSMACMGYAAAKFKLRSILNRPPPPGKNPRILVTGGCGYIGSHTILCLLNAGFDITVVDNLVNSSPESLRRVRRLAGADESRLTFHEVDLCDVAKLENVFRSSPQFAACIHFAGLKAVGESTQKPLLYYENNLGGTFNLLSLMSKYNCKSIVFSSSATVYGAAEVPITEDTPTGQGITNAYGRTKYMIEEVLRDFRASPAGQDWKVVILRYFNPVGSHPSGEIGEDPQGPPNNLMPYVAQVVVGRREKLTVFGNTYNTPDGTGVRDYIHVMDLADGHVKALGYTERKGPGYYVFNLGTGQGYSVLQMVEAMKRASGKDVPYEIGAPRPGDIAVCYASTEKASQELGWTATRDLNDMCQSLYKWQTSNPRGYST